MSLFGFRTPTDSGLINFFIKTGGGNNTVNGRFYIDDIYLEDTDNINLSNPIITPTRSPSWLPSLLLYLLDE
jgi:hypothetical protein